jgi:sugar-specific transcriptional regulator TrmB
MDIQLFLQNQGFSVTDIAVYLDVYAHDRSFASTIAVRTHKERTTVYSALKRLIKRGVIAQTTINGVKAYMALSPEVFFDHIDQEMFVLEQKKKEIFCIIDEMKKMKKQISHKTYFTLHEGENALKSLYYEALVPESVHKAFLTLHDIPKTFLSFLQTEFMRKKKEKNVQSRVIVPNTPFASRYKKLDSVSNRTTKIVEKRPFDIHSEIIILDQKKVIVIDFSKPSYGMMIESPTYHKTIETLFDYVWENERGEF